jgi:hypothetical protein
VVTSPAYAALSQHLLEKCFNCFLACSTHDRPEFHILKQAESPFFRAGETAGAEGRVTICRLSPTPSALPTGGQKCISKRPSKPHAPIPPTFCDKFIVAA